jgi:hypothetical protein
MITWSESMLPIVGVVDRCSCCWCLGCNAFMHLVLHAIEVLVTGRQGHCVRMGMLSLSL